jgi:hypothetical protein
VWYAASLGGDLRVVTVEIDAEETARLRQRWNDFLPDIPLEVLASPYRSVVSPLVDYLDRFIQNRGDYVTVVVPEFVPSRWWHHLLHNQTAWLLRMALLYGRRDWRGRYRIITDVPFYLTR